MQRPMTERHIRDLLQKIRFRDWTLTLAIEGSGEQHYILQWEFEAPDIDTGKPEIQRGRKWRVSQYATDSEVIQTAFAAALMAVEHECREDFTYRDQRVFGPHLDLDAMVETAQKTSHRD